MTLFLDILSVGAHNIIQANIPFRLLGVHRRNGRSSGYSWRPIVSERELESNGE